LKRGIAALIALALLLVPASAFAAPDNDDFADRLALGPGFPHGEAIEETASNVDADKEGGEFIPGPGPAGHSVWFEWEAEADGWVSIGACEADFPTILAVFTGTEVEHLEQVADDNGNEGPDCPFEQSQYTFFAASGAEYVIAVDGNSSPGPVPVVTEGEFTLRIEETPVPPNDEFADATEIVGSFSEEPDGSRRFYASVRGFSWTAGIEHGEPDETTSGASVWYSLTAPEDATYRFNPPCCQGALALNLDLYLGDAVDELTPLVVGGEGAEVDLAAGETVRIRVSGPIQGGSEEPLTASFTFLVLAELTPLAQPPTSGGGSSTPSPSPPQDIEAPETTIAKTVLRRTPPIFVFKFGSSEPGSSFRCSLDGEKFKPCAAGRRYGQPLPGRHKLRVVAVDGAGNVDSTPAVGHFRFPRPQPRQGQGGGA